MPTTLKNVKPPTAVPGSQIRDNLDLGSLATVLTLSNAVLNEEVAAQLTALMEADKRHVLAATRESLTETVNQMLCAVLLEFVRESGPEGARLSIYLHRDAGPAARHRKNGIDRYRRILRNISE